MSLASVLVHDKLCFPLGYLVTFEGVDIKYDKKYLRKIYVGVVQIKINR